MVIKSGRKFTIGVKYEVNVRKWDSECCFIYLMLFERY